MLLIANSVKTIIEFPMKSLTGGRQRGIIFYGVNILASCDHDK